MGNRIGRKTVGVVALFLISRTFCSAQTRKDFRFNTSPGCVVLIDNDFGQVTVSPAQGEYVLVSTASKTDKPAISPLQSGNRIELRTRLPKHISAEDGSVDYQVRVPKDATLTIRSVSGPVRISGLQGDVTAESESGEVEISASRNAHVHVRTVEGPVTLTRLDNTFVDVTSIGGTVMLQDVSGPKVTINTGEGDIRYSGDLGRNGIYTFVNHSGNIIVMLPPSASVDVSAHCLKGNIESDFPLSLSQQPSGAAQGKFLRGTSNSAASSLRITSFLGNISLKKQ